MTVESQRAFLTAITDDTTPVTYVASSLTHTVYITRLAELSPYKREESGRQEPVYQLTMVATAAEASGVSSEEQFLLSAANDVVPLVYTDRNEERHYVYVTRLVKTRPFKDEDRYEPVYGLTMVDARAVMEVQDAEGARVSAVVAASLYRETMTWGTSRWSFCQWE